MSLNGCGAPKEHLRPPIIDMLANAPSEQRQRRFTNDLIRFAQRRGFIGTKIIAHFMEDALPFVDVPLLRRQIEKLRSFRIIYLVRRDKVLQAISTERAIQTNIYHVRTPDMAAASQAASFSYDFDRLKHRVDQLNQREEALQALIASLPYRSLVVEYEQLSVDPAIHLPSILAFLGRQTDDLKLTTRITRIRDQSADALAEQFCKEHRSRLGVAARRFCQIPVPAAWSA
ncbi:Stf0 sulfotransferase [Rubellimicrobium thermophilum DSM 16684]|uniref:Stf0 sulfotransferase n=1 Tax=Rubellimicrobium thermophilum DSM 16684 TaxID=1123069 RepID=S9SIZ2_9RHOB|nr:Stf0 sulfotransferase [Rubellimicrobium thermophilum DSM 16684]